ncbi:GNAT family N-acetyltransferase [Paenibacillus macquariensis]|uniref:Acetyltransferase (GNAT) domain-containing protein n=1 Tax=Paenibacillus macquariensis TaxID=948756 RepID=A0ABY1JPG8_9BACL|nr:GNAT family N-acetyltransferase [Paenibacillus macquariensis]MEC0091977.1 GNAT family N-acetyltransferase [Paenibacillus macquariensis]OAB37450.1 acetyltransferase [Paenibacillus macquariensis subsp. macquariensis]SIQ53513.1 Acetyltransferase (GNAT) domain-containing protein [Paenibacillus macquariensis]
MEISLVKSGLNEASTIHEMQMKAFMPLFDKYQDFETSPANESVERIISRMNQSFTDYYIIKSSNISLGAVRIVRKENETYRVSPIFVLPEYQGKGIAQTVFVMIEDIYNDARIWGLDTIMQERGNCYLYEKLGYKRTGEAKVINDKMTIVFYEKHLV